MPNEINKITEALSKAGIIISQGVYQRQDRLDAEGIYDKTVKGYEDYRQSMKIYNDALRSAQTLLDGGQNPKMPIKPSFDGVATSFFEALGDLGANPQGAPYKDALSQLYKSLTTNQEPEVRTVGNNLLQYNPNTGGWDEVYKGDEDVRPYTQIKPRVEKMEDGTYRFKNPFYNDNGDVVYTYSNATLDDWLKQEADDTDNAMTDEDKIKMRKSYNPPRSRTRTRTNSNPLNRTEQDDYNDIINWGNSGKGWGNKTDEQREAYIKKEQELADRLFGGDIKKLRETKEKMLKTDTEQGRRIFKESQGEGEPPVEQKPKLKDGQKDPKKPIQTEVIEQRQKEWEAELKNDSQKQAFDRVNTWFSDVTGPHGWGRSDLTKEQWLDEIGQETWNDIEWQILKKEFYKITKDNLDKYFK